MLRDHLFLGLRFGLLSCGVVATTVFAGVTPTKEGTIYTYTLDSGSDTVDEAIPADATKVVKAGAGQLTFTVPCDTTFTRGEVEIQGGTLHITNAFVLGADDVDVTVKDGGTFSFNIPLTNGNYNVVFNHKVTIAGAGSDGKGAIKAAYSSTTERNASAGEGVFKELVLSADATVNTDRRWGLRPKQPLNLNGHTLSTFGSNALMLYCPVSAGHIRADNGNVTLQGEVTFAGSAEDSSLHATGGKAIRLYDVFNTVTIPILLSNNGKLVSSKGDNVKTRNRISDLVLTNSVSTTSAETAYVRFEGNADVTIPVTGSIRNGAWCHLKLEKGGKGVKTLVVDGVVDLHNAELGKTSALYVEQDVNMTVNGADESHVADFRLQDGSFTLTDGSLFVDSWFRMANAANTASLLRQTGGSLWARKDETGGSAVVDQANSEGCFYKEGGLTVISNHFSVGRLDNSYGAYIQRDGTFALAPSQSAGVSTFKLGGTNSMDKGTLSVGLYYQSGGEVDLVQNALGKNADTFQTTAGGGNTVFALTGSNTLFNTERIILGRANSVCTNIYTVSEGATLAARRFFREANNNAHVIVNVDGGIVKPTLAWGWDDKGNVATYAERAPEHVYVYGKGLTFDISGAIDNSGNPIYSRCGLMFEGATGKGIGTITLPSDLTLTDYTMPAHIRIEGSGNGASAFVDYDFTKKQLGSVIVMSAGCGYGEDTKVYVESADRSTLIECSYTLRDNEAGPIRFKGCGLAANRLELFRDAGWTTETIIDNVRVDPKTTTALPQKTAYTLANNGCLNLGNASVEVSSLGGYGSVTAAVVRVSDKLRVSCKDIFEKGWTTILSGELILADNVTLEVTDPEFLKDYEGVPAAPAFVAVDGVSGAIPTIAFADGVARPRWTARNAGGALNLGYSQGLILHVR